MDISSLTPLIGNVGVPAVICLYTLFEVNKNVKKLTDSVDRLTKSLEPRIEKIEQKLFKE